MRRAAVAAALALFSIPAGPGTLAQSAGGSASQPQTIQEIATALDRLFEGSPALARAHVAVRVESLHDGRTLYARNNGRLLIPASVMKLVTVAVAADRLGWDHRFETRLDAIGPVAGGTLTGDLVVAGDGDPSIGLPDAGHAALFLEWAEALRQAGISSVRGRLVGDDNAFDDERLGAGWAWDYLSAGYAAPAGALNYNENVAVVRLSPGPSPGLPAGVALSPPGHLLEPASEVTTGEPGSSAAVSFFRLPGSNRLRIRGVVPASGATVIRTAAVDNPTRSFVEGLRLALAERGIRVSGGAWDVDDLPGGIAAGERRTIARRESAPLSSLAGYALKVSQNFYGEVLLKAIGRTTGAPGSAETGRQVVLEVLSSWGVPADSIVMFDGSGLSRYNYLTADALVAVLRRAWVDERLRGPFLAALPVGGHDGTLESRMKNGRLDRRVQAKTGTIANVRSLAGYLETDTGRKLAFAMIANNFTAPAAEIDAAMEQALELLSAAK